MWNCTPPGTSQEYGQTMPIFTEPPLGVQIGEPEPLQHVPVLRVLGDPAA